MPLLRRLWRLHEGPIEHEGRFYRLQRPADRAVRGRRCATTSRSTWPASTRAWSRPPGRSPTGSSATRCSRPSTCARSCGRRSHAAPSGPAATAAADRRLRHVLGRRGPRRRPPGRRARSSPSTRPSRPTAPIHRAERLRGARRRHPRGLGARRLGEAMAAAVTDEMIDADRARRNGRRGARAVRGALGRRVRAHPALAARVPGTRGRARGGVRVLGVASGGPADPCGARGRDGRGGRGPTVDVTAARSASTHARSRSAGSTPDPWSRGSWGR